MRELNTQEIEMVCGGMLSPKLRPWSTNVEDRRTTIWKSHPLWKNYRGIFPRFGENLRFPSLR